VKLSKDKIYQMINEEVSSDARVAKILEDILAATEESLEKLKDLDVSMDYVASSLTGKEPAEIELTQKTYGRAAAAKEVEE
jgi:hypothetical protein